MEMSKDTDYPVYRIVGFDIVDSYTLQLVDNKE